jgi:hypothetical protein
VATTDDLHVGRTYRVASQRKGTFTARIDAVNGEWVDLTIVSGRAKAMLHYNVREEGEAVTVRRSMASFEPIEEVRRGDD